MYDYTDFEPENKGRDGDVEYLTIRKDGEEMATLIHRSKYETPEDRRLKLNAAHQIVTALNLLDRVTSGEAFHPDKVTLKYVDDDGEETYDQPLSDLNTSGTLIDPYSGEDLHIFGAQITL